jgi:nucleotide-binding universal stress UspA family protein
MKILLAVDGSPCSDLAIAEVARRPWPAEAVVHVVAVDASVEPSLFRGALPTVFDEIVKQKRAEISKRLTEAVSTIQRLAPSLRVLPTLLAGAPKDAIIDEAARWSTDLIVVGSHGCGPIRRFFLGSMSLFVHTTRLIRSWWCASLRRFSCGGHASNRGKFVNETEGVEGRRGTAVFGGVR